MSKLKNSAIRKTSFPKPYVDKLNITLDLRMKICYYLVLTSRLQKITKAKERVGSVDTNISNPLIMAVIISNID